ncbi:MAG: YicC family protein [Bacteroidia bacterium]
MIQSMTGYGAATHASSNYSVTVELKSLNSKYFELMIKLPRVYLKYENKVRAYLSEKLVRGKVIFLMNVDVLNPDKRTLNINRNLVKGYYDELKSLGAFLGLESQVDLNLILNLPDVIPTEIEEEDPEEWQLIEGAMTDACKQMIASRNEEGRALDADLAQRITAISGALDEIKELAPQRTAAIRARIEQSLDDIRHKVELDQNRFEQELIFYIEKLDINEEIVRLTQHLSYFESLRKAPESNGKQLSFLSQELGREINTIGSKANDAAIQRLVVLMKDELDKIKEQIMNAI